MACMWFDFCLTMPILFFLGARGGNFRGATNTDSVWLQDEASSQKLHENIKLWDCKSVNEASFIPNADSLYFNCTTICSAISKIFVHIIDVICKGGILYAIGMWGKYEKR